MRVEIKKFKNGNIRFYNSEYETGNVEEYVNGEMFWNDLYFKSVDGINYIFDFNTGHVYDLSFVAPYTFESLGIIEALRFSFELYSGLILLFPLGTEDAREVVDNYNAEEI